MRELSFYRLYRKTYLTYQKKTHSLNGFILMDRMLRKSKNIFSQITTPPQKANNYWGRCCVCLISIIIFFLDFSKIKVLFIIFAASFPFLPL